MQRSFKKLITRILTREEIFVFTKSDISRNEYMLTEKLAQKGYDCWRHLFTGKSLLTGQEKTFFIEYFLCNPALAGDRPVLGQSPENRTAGKRPSYLMIKAGHWGKNARQIHRFLAWKKISLRQNAPFSLKASDCLLSETFLKGCVSVSDAEAARNPQYLCQSGSMSWNLQVNKKIPFHAGHAADSFIRTLHASNTCWHAQGMKTEYEGTVTLDGEEYLINPETSYGYADKLWGSDFDPSRVHLSSSDLLSSKTGLRLTNSAFVFAGSPVKIFFTRKQHRFTGGLFYEGSQFEFNFLKFLAFPSTKFYCQETPDELTWHIRLESLTALVKLEVHCPKNEMLFMNYESPDGTNLSGRLISGGTGTGFLRLYRKTGTRRVLIDELVARHVNCTCHPQPQPAE